MLRSHHRRTTISLVWVIGLSFVAQRYARAELAPIDPQNTPVFLQQSLRLEVFVNGAATHLAEPFTLTADQHLLGKAADLEDIGIKMSNVDPRKTVGLATLPGVTFRFDAPAQSIDFHIPDAFRAARVYDARQNEPVAVSPQVDWGALANYALFGSSMKQLGGPSRFTGMNATIDARAFSPYGVMTQSAIIGDTPVQSDTYLRLDSSYTYSAPNLLLTGRAGDAISGGLVWTRPIRYGGLQVQRDFALRSDLVTRPLANVSGSAAVPSTVDVFVNSVKAYSQVVTPGPYTITNLPVVSGNGIAHVVVTDASGRQSDTAAPFFTAPMLLAAGLTDFSLDAGYARRNYGLISDDYDKKPLGSVSSRHGVTDWLTVEGHAEGGSRLANGGAGINAVVGRFGTISAAVSGSRFNSDTGGQFYVGYYLEIAGFALDASTQRTIRTYNDLASATATTGGTTSLTSLFATSSFAQDPRPPRALDRITLSVPLKFDVASLSMSVIDLLEADGTRSRIISASLARPLPCGASMFATAAIDTSRHNSGGVFVGISVPLGARVQAQGGLASDGSDRYGSIDVAQSLQQTNGSIGWRVRDLEGTGASRTADVAYRSPYGVASAEVSQQSRIVSAQSEFDGSIGVMSGSGFFIGNHVNDGFAVVDTGLPGVPVYQDNRLIGETNPWGKLMIPDLHSYQINRIGIDPLALPTNAEAEATHQNIAPAARSGVAVKFGIDTHVDAAVVRLQDGNGQALPVGTKGRLQNDGDGFVIGYEGIAYIRHLKAANTLIVDLGDRECTAIFAYSATGGKRVAIGPIPCR